MSQLPHNAYYADLPANEREALEMAGYAAGWDGHVRYNNSTWSEAQRAAYRKGYAEGSRIRLQRNIVTGK
jgi:hypothetical protein